METRHFSYLSSHLWIIFVHCCSFFIHERYLGRWWWWWWFRKLFKKVCWITNFVKSLWKFLRVKSLQTQCLWTTLTLNVPWDLFMKKVLSWQSIQITVPMLAHSAYPKFLKMHRYTKRKHVKKNLEGLQNIRSGWWQAKQFC